MSETNDDLQWPAPPITLRLTLLEVTSVILLTTRKRVTKTGSPSVLHEHYRSVQAHNWIAGWWGIPMGIIWTPLALYRNHQARSKLDALTTTGAASAAWFADPSGRHTKRYWDGST